VAISPPFLGESAMAEREPLIFLPGLLCDDALFAPQVEALRDVADPLVMPLTAHSAIDDYAADVLARAPDRFALAGLSMGGYCALAIARRAAGRVTRLALLNTSARPDDPPTLKRRRGLITLSERGAFKGVTPKLLPLLLSEAGLKNAALVETITTMAQRVGQPAFVRQQKAIMSRIDSRPFLSAIDAPTVVIAGEQDALTPPSLAEELADGIPAAELIRLPDCGHLSTLEQPDAVSAALRQWLMRAPSVSS